MSTTTTPDRLAGWYGPEQFNGPQDEYHLDELASFSRVLDEVEELVREGHFDLWDRFCTGLNSLAVAAERVGAVAQGRLIAAAIAGDVVMYGEHQEVQWVAGSHLPTA